MESTVEIPDDEVKEYAKDNIFMEDIYSEDEIVEWVKTNKSPEDVFDTKELREWAEKNGFVEA